MHDTPPPDAAVDCVNVRVWLPLPHVLLQVPHEPHDPTQLVAHAVLVVEDQRTLAAMDGYQFAAKFPVWGLRQIQYPPL